MSRSHASLLALVAACATPLASDPAAAETRSFRDWIAACDNMRGCSAYGAVGEQSGAVLRIERDGAPEAPVRITVAADVPKGASIRLSLDGRANPGAPQDVLKGTEHDDGYSRFVIPEGATAPLLASLRNASRLRITPVDPAAGPRNDPPTADVSLSGLAAALLWIDDQQKRVGTETALIGRGAKPASGVPALPAPPVVTAVPADRAPAPTTHPPAVVAKRTTVCGKGETSGKLTQVTRLGKDRLLYWFRCDSLSGAYNSTYVLLAAPADQPQAAQVAALVFPPALAAELKVKEESVTNPAFDGTTLTTFAKGRGVGDCGSWNEWVWDGRAFRLALSRTMPECRGIPADDWPVVYRAQRQ